MIHSENKFKVGDWVILTEEYAKESLTRDVKGRYVKDYKLPQEILEIRYQESTHISTLFVFAPNRITTMERSSFRLATEKEIKMQKIKNSFIEKNKSTQGDKY